MAFSLACAYLAIKAERAKPAASLRLAQDSGAMAGTGEDQKLFPMLAILKFDNGTQRFRFEITSSCRKKLITTTASCSGCRRIIRKFNHCQFKFKSTINPNNLWIKKQISFKSLLPKVSRAPKCQAKL